MSLNLRKGKKPAKTRSVRPTRPARSAPPAPEAIGQLFEARPPMPKVSKTEAPSTSTSSVLPGNSLEAIIAAMESLPAKGKLLVLSATLQFLLAMKGEVHLTSTLPVRGKRPQTIIPVVDLEGSAPQQQPVSAATLVLLSGYYMDTISAPTSTMDTNPVLKATYLLVAGDPSARSAFAAKVLVTDKMLSARTNVRKLAKAAKIVLAVSILKWAEDKLDAGDKRKLKTPKALMGKLKACYAENDLCDNDANQAIKLKMGATFLSTVLRDHVRSIANHKKGTSTPLTIEEAFAPEGGDAAVPKDGYAPLADTVWDTVQESP